MFRARKCSSPWRRKPRGKVAVTDMATPLTMERYCATHEGSYMTDWPARPLVPNAPARYREGLYFAGQRTSFCGGLPPGRPFRPPGRPPPRPRLPPPLAQIANAIPGPVNRLSPTTEPAPKAASAALTRKRVFGRATSQRGDCDGIKCFSVLLP